MQAFCHAAHSCFLLTCYVSCYCCRESPLPLTCPDRRSRRPLRKPAHFPDFPPGGDVGPHQKPWGPKPMEMLWSPVCGDDTPDGEALPPGLCVLSDQQEECQSCLHSHFSFPTQLPALALGVSCSGRIWHRSCGLGQVLSDWLRAIRQILVALNITGRELEPDPFSPRGTLCPLFISYTNSLSFGGEWFNSRARWPGIKCQPCHLSAV